MHLDVGVKTNGTKPAAADQNKLESKTTTPTEIANIKPEPLPFVKKGNIAPIGEAAMLESPTSTASATQPMVVNNITNVAGGGGERAGLNSAKSKDNIYSPFNPANAKRFRNLDSIVVIG